MADQRITQLVELTEGAVAANDVLPIVDVGGSETKKITVKSLAEAGYSLSDNASIDLSKLDQASATKLGTAAIEDGSITAAKLANDSSIAVDSSAPVDDNFEGRGFFNSTDGNLKVYSAGSYAQIVLPASGIADGAISTDKLADGAVTTAKVTALETAAFADDSITAAKILDGAITTSKISPGAITASELSVGSVDAAALAADAVDTVSVVDAAITEAKIADGAIAESKLQSGAVTNDKISDATIAAGKLNLADGSISGSKISDASISSTQLADASVGTAELITSSVTTIKIADDAVTADKLATDSVTADAVATGAIGTSELASSAVTYDRIQNISATDRILGRSSAGAGSVEEIPCTTAGRSIIGAADAADQRTILGLGNLAVATGTWTNGSTFSGTSSGTNTGDQTIQLTGDVTGIGTGTFAATISDGAVTGAKIASDSITTVKIAGDAVTAAKLADNSTALVQAGIPAGSGDYIGQEYINTNNDIAYYWDGSDWQLKSVSIPEATDAVSGTVKVGTGLAMNASGQLDHTNSVATGTYTKVTVDAQGHVSEGATLDPADIPDLDASKITTGTFGSAFLAPNSVTAEQLADNGIAQVSQSAPDPQFSGQWWINPNDRSTYIWVGTVGPTLETSNGYWLNLGYGNLQQENLRFAGTYTASGNVVETVTTYSEQVGINIGEALPAPAEGNSGLYYIITASGTGTGFAPNEALAPGDWVVSLGQGTNWERLDFGSAVAGVSDQDVLVNGPSLVPAASGIATQEDFNEDVWSRVQIATTSVNGIVRASSEIEVSASGVMTVGIVDDGTY